MNIYLLFTWYAIVLTLGRFGLFFYKVNSNLYIKLTHNFNQHLHWYIFVLLYIQRYVQIKGDKVINASVKIRVYIYLGKFLPDVYSHSGQLIFPPLRQRLSYNILEIRILDIHPIVERRFWSEEHTGELHGPFIFHFCCGVYRNIKATHAKLNFQVFLLR